MFEGVKKALGLSGGFAPQVGDAVSHDGNFANKTHPEGRFEITRIFPKAMIVGMKAVVVQFCEFENTRFRVLCELGELVWFEEDGAWMLPGRLLSRDQRARWQEQMSLLTGVKITQGPHPDRHPEARQFLRERGVLSNG